LSSSCPRFILAPLPIISLPIIINITYPISCSRYLGLHTPQARIFRTQPVETFPDLVLFAVIIHERCVREVVCQTPTAEIKIAWQKKKEN
jgi:hypothetical protein